MARTIDNVPRLVVVIMLVTFALAAPAYADDSVQFTIGRVLHTTPDKHDRVGIRSVCADPGGCKVDYTLTRGSTMLGGIQALFQASDPDGNRVTLTKRVTLGPNQRR